MNNQDLSEDRCGGDGTYPFVDDKPREPRLGELRPNWWPMWTDYPHSAWSLEQAREISRYVVALEKSNKEARDLNAARVATARVCEYCHGKGDFVNPDNVFGPTDKCPHCTNGVVISDERAREMLGHVANAKRIVHKLVSVASKLGYSGTKDAEFVEDFVLDRLRKAEEDSALLDWLETQRADSADHWTGTDGKRYANLPILARIYAEGETVRELIRAERAQKEPE